MNDNFTDNVREGLFMLAQAVREEMETRRWSFAQAQIQTGVNRSTIHNMSKGLNVDVDNLVQWAKKTASKGRERENILRYLRLAHRDELAELMVSAPMPERPSLLDVAETVQNEAQILQALSQVVDVGANLERLTPVDAAGDPVWFGSSVHVMRIRHECMQPLLNSGDVVFVTQPDTVRDGDIVIAAVDIFSRTCKILRTPAGEPAYLEPINGEGRIHEGRFTVLGVVKFKLQPVSGS